VRAVAHDLNVQPGDSATTQPDRPASRPQVRALIDELLDEQRYRLGVHDAMQGERLYEYDTVINVIGTRGAASAGVAEVPTFLCMPTMFRLDAQRMMRLTTQIQTAGGATDFQSARAAMPASVKPARNVSQARWVTQMLSSILMPSLHRVVESHFRGLLERRVAALRLAIRLYQIDHEGHYPERLNELVPNYISSLPADPFRGDGSPLGYVRSPTTAPLLYSVGLDGKDSGGDPSLPPSRRSRAPVSGAGNPDDRYRWERADWIFPLGKPPPTATQPTDEESGS
jgi:hypothetical protein